MGVAGKTGGASIEGAITRTQPLPAQAGGLPRGAFSECPPAPPRPDPVAGGRVNEALVWISDGLPPGDYPLPSEPVMLDQRGCEFSPRVFGLRAGQDLVLRNSETGPDGAFALRGLPAGSFTLSVWHERLGRRSVSVSLKEAQAARMEISLDGIAP